MGERIKVSLTETGKINWTRGGSGISVRDFVESYPCKALKHLASGASDDLAEAVISVIGGKGNLIEFNKQNLCGEDDGVLQQV